MNPWHKRPFRKVLLGSSTILRWLITLVLVLGLASCSEKAVSQQVSISARDKPQQISQQFSEVSPPDVIQELRSNLEIYQPQVTIVNPQPEEVISDNTVSVRFQVKDLPIFKHPQWQLGPYLHVIVDNQPYIPVYDLSQPLVLSDLSPGTHTLRVFASRPWHESFKNEGAYAQTTFHVFTKSDDNNPDSRLPLLTYSSPQGSYGAEPILLDFYLANAPLHLAAKEQSNDQFSDWRIRCTINGESFVFDRWQAVYLKGFKPGKNWVKLEFLDNQGNPVKNAFNTTVRLFDYQPNSKDTLSRIVRGELNAEEVRGIVDPIYVAKPSVAEPTPVATPSPEPEKSALPEVTEIVPTPEATEPPQTTTLEPEKPKGGGFFSRPRPQPSPSLTPTLPEVTESPLPQPEVTPIPSPTITPEPQPEVTPTASPTVTPEPQPEVTPTASPTITPEPQPEVTPTSPAELEKPVTQRKKVNLGDYFKRRPRPTVTPTPTVTEQPTESSESS
ncbi:hypothetical protein ACN23B_25850 [Anabaena sp. FACHB-709]|uniref:FHA domain containing protein n=2 Tax=Nostocaceae TaxID=1162 RepID=A0A1Z4KP74_ANAVA|nr:MULTISPECIES: hypothetical protein [Nostocaceae]BAY70752.1 hypothetical protein NIES23_35600 [Trichormus variabilis NIES-23]HBW31377.1 hypothetical protein [Nostoc sp. UBA8866]MBD2172719.1 hypothetical protein [Anabaena cylindrica FACHB-318]MBD2264312.1 hypothetical protein [Anabaena sp. FACHB-709]MBD2276459.1 hypothetical protein [Nostoc sp. PCC 7120 = FACHB-418]